MHAWSRRLHWSATRGDKSHLSEKKRYCVKTTMPIYPRSLSKPFGHMGEENQKSNETRARAENDQSRNSGKMMNQLHNIFRSLNSGAASINANLNPFSLNTPVRHLVLENQLHDIPVAFNIPISYLPTYLPTYHFPARMTNSGVSIRLIFRSARRTYHSRLVYQEHIHARFHSATVVIDNSRQLGKILHNSFP